MEARKSYLEERQNEDNREARHILADQLGIDLKSDDQEKIHQRRLLGLWLKGHPKAILGHSDLGHISMKIHINKPNGLLKFENC